MASLQSLTDRLAALDAQIETLKATGYVAYPAGFTLDGAVMRGHTYYRKRSPSGSEQIKPETYNQLRAELANGKAIHKLEKQRQGITRQMDAIASQIAALGGTLPKSEPAPQLEPAAADPKRQRLSSTMRAGKPAVATVELELEPETLIHNPAGWRGWAAIAIK